jgi:hypothetical protein
LIIEQGTKDLNYLKVHMHQFFLQQELILSLAGLWGSFPIDIITRLVARVGATYSSNQLRNPNQPTLATKTCHCVAKMNILRTILQILQSTDSDQNMSLHNKTFWQLVYRTWDQHIDQNILNGSNVDVLMFFASECCR